MEIIDTVFILEIPYTNVYYYSEYTFMKPIYKPIEVLNYDDLSLDKYITNLYNSMDKKLFKAPLYSYWSFS